MQYFITCAPAPGWDHVRRARRNWKKSGTLVEVVDEEEDPNVPLLPGAPLLIGKKTWEELKGDGRIFARPAGDIEDIAAASVALVEARERIKALEAEIATLKGETPPAPAAKVEEPPHAAHAPAHGKGKKG